MNDYRQYVQEPLIDTAKQIHVQAGSLRALCKKTPNNPRIVNVLFPDMDQMTCLS